MSHHTTKRKNEITPKKKGKKPAPKEEDVIDLSVSDPEDEDTKPEKKTKVEAQAKVEAQVEAKAKPRVGEEQVKASVSASDKETVKSYRRMLEQSPALLDAINEELLPLLFHKVSMVRGKPLEWQEEVTVTYLDDPDSECTLPQCQLLLLKSTFHFTDQGNRKWIEVMVLADPVHCKLHVMSRLMGEPEHGFKQESQVALPREPTAEKWHAVCLAVEDAFEAIFEDIYCEEEDNDEDNGEEQEFKTPPKKAKPATLIKDTDSDDDSDSDDSDDDDEPMPPVQAKEQGQEEKTQSQCKKPRGNVPDEMKASIRAILEKGLFRRNDYGYFLTILRNVFNDDKAWEDMLADHRDPQFDLNNALCERRRLWARVTEGKSPATDRELLEMVRGYNEASVKLQAQRLDCIEELKAMKPEIKELCKSSGTLLDWTRYWGNLANSIVNLDNLNVCITLGVYPSDYTWKEVREVLEDRMLADGQKLPPLDSTLVYDAKKEMETLEKVWEPVKARIQDSAFARFIL